MNKYLKFEYWNTCDLGNIYYQGGQHFWFFLDGDVLEPFHEETEDGQENGDGDFIPTYRRGMKRYKIRTGLVPDYMVDAIQRMKLHDNIELTFKTGEIEQIYNVDVEMEWQFEKMCHQATVVLTFDMDEKIVVGACCDNLTVGGYVDPPVWDVSQVGVYYVKEGGDDDLDGQTDATAWETITRANTALATAGTISVSFKRGDIFIGTLTPTVSGTSSVPKVISAYGTGTNPIIDGLTTLTSWTRVGATDVYYASVTPQSVPLMVLYDGVQVGMGRWPNTSMNIIDTVNSSTEIVDTELSEPPDWTGGELVIRKNRWIIDRHPIINHVDDTLTFTENSDYNPATGYGYFIQGHLSTLDVEGEWYYDSATNRLYVDFGGDLPTVHTVRVSVLDKGVSITDRNYITIDGITLQGFNTHAVYAYFASYTNQQNIVVQNCSLLYNGGYGVYIQRPNYCSVIDNIINYTNHCAIWFYGAYGDNAIIRGNTISNSGTFEGLAEGTTTGIATAQYSAININSNNAFIEDNYIYNTGYIPINYRGTNTLVQNNFVDTFGFVKDDCAGIYCFSDTSLNKRVYNNIIINGVGITDGVPAGKVNAHGLYADGAAENIVFSGNIIAHIPSAVFHANDAANITIQNNTCFQCVEFLNLTHHNGWQNFTGLDIQYNTFVSTVIVEELPSVILYQSTNTVLLGGTVVSEFQAMGTIDNNYYYLNTENAVYCILNPASTGFSGFAPYTIARWAAETGHDANSTVLTKQAEYSINSLSANMLSNSTFDANVNNWTGSANAVISWDNTNALSNAGSLKLETQNPTYEYYWWENTFDFYAALGAGVDVTKHYILRVRTKSDIDGKTIAFKTRTTGTDHPIQRFFASQSAAADKEILLSFPETVASPNLYIVSCDDETNVWFDNLYFYEADVTLIPYTNYLHLIYNEDVEDKTFSLSANMVDVAGNLYSGTITLNQWESLILIGTGTVTEL